MAAIVWGGHLEMSGPSPQSGITFLSESCGRSFPLLSLQFRPRSHNPLSPPSHLLVPAHRDVSQPRLRRVRSERAALPPGSGKTTQPETKDDHYLKQHQWDRLVVRESHTL